MPIVKFVSITRTTHSRSIHRILQILLTTYKSANLLLDAAPCAPNVIEIIDHSESQRARKLDQDVVTLQTRKGLKSIERDLIGGYFYTGIVPSEYLAMRHKVTHTAHSLSKMIGVAAHERVLMKRYAGEGAWHSGHK